MAVPSSKQGAFQPPNPHSLGLSHRLPPPLEKKSGITSDGGVWGRGHLWSGVLSGCLGNPGWEEGLFPAPGTQRAPEKAPHWPFVLPAHDVSSYKTFLWGLASACVHGGGAFGDLVSESCLGSTYLHFLPSPESS